MMRELLAVFSGNELVFGIVLGNWLLLTGVGSMLGQTVHRISRPLVLLVCAQVVIALLPIVDVFLLRLLRNVVFVRGAEVGLPEITGSCFILLAPYCLVAGYLLTLACFLLARRGEEASIGRVYFLDNIGDVVGGGLFSLVLIYWFEHFQILYFPALLNLVFAVLVAGFDRRRILAFAVLLIAVASVTVVLKFDLERISTQIEYAGQRVVYQANSPYGSLVVTRLGDQYNFIENGVVLFSTNNTEKVEETVHYAMAQRPDARDVLLISGGVSGTARELLKYPIDRIDYVELDPLIIEVANMFVPESLGDSRIHIVNTDGRLFIRQTANRYDVVILDVPDPSTFQINRFYTSEFFEEIKRKLTDGGVVSLSLGRRYDYLGEELADVIAVLHNTLREVFTHVLMIPGGQVYFLASDVDLIGDIAGQIEKARVSTEYVNRNYLNATITPDRMAELKSAVENGATVNRDFYPVLYYYDLRYWMSQFKVRFGLLEGLLLLMLVVYLLRIRPVSFAIFTTGFAASTLEVVLLIGFQVLYGSVYNKVGLIVTMFLLGLGIGSYIVNRSIKRRKAMDLVVLEGAVAVYAVLIPFVLMGFGYLDGVATSIAAQIVIPVSALVLAILVGMEFPLAGKMGFQQVTSTAAKLYSADYFGAAIGALLASTLLIPIIGVVYVCFLVAGLNILSGVILFCRPPT